MYVYVTKNTQFQVMQSYFSLFFSLDVEIKMLHIPHRPLRQGNWEKKKTTNCQTLTLSSLPWWEFSTSPVQIWTGRLNEFPWNSPKRRGYIYVMKTNRRTKILEAGQLNERQRVQCLLFVVFRVVKIIKNTCSESRSYTSGQNRGKGSL